MRALGLTLTMLVLAAAPVSAHNEGYLPTPKPIEGGTSGGVPTPPGYGEGMPAPRTGPEHVGGPEHWAFWWRVNRERLLGLRELEAARWGGSPTPAERRSAALAALRTAAREGGPEVAAAAAIALGRARDPLAVPILAGRVLEENTPLDLLRAALLGIGMIGRPGPPSRAALEPVLLDVQRDLETRSVAALALGLLGDRGALPALLHAACAKETPRAVADASLLAVGLIGGEIAADEIGRHLPSGRPCRVAAMLAAARAPEADQRAAIRAGLRAKDEGVRRQAALTLGATCSRADAAVVRDLVVVVSAHPDPLFRAYAAVALARLGPEGAEEALLGAFESCLPPTTPWMALSLGLLARGARGSGLRERVRAALRARLSFEKGEDLRGALVLALALAGDTSRVPSLDVPAGAEVGDEFRGHQAVAVGLLGVEGSGRAVEKLLLEADSATLREEAALALRLLGRRSVLPVLLGRLREGESEYERARAADALGRLGDGTAVEALVAVLANGAEPAPVRSIAARALGRILDGRAESVRTLLGCDAALPHAGPALREVLRSL